MTYQQVRPGFDIGRVIARVFAAIRARPDPLLGAACFVVLPEMVLGWLYWQALSGLGPLSGLNAQWWMSSSLSILTNALAQAVIVPVALAYWLDRPRDPGRVRRTMRRSLAPLVAAGLLAGAGMALGLVLLIVPGFIFMVLWIVVAPVVIEEPSRGVFGAFERSRDLTRGWRWPIFALAVIFVVGWMTLLLIATAPFGLFSASPDPTFQLVNEALMVPLMGGLGALVGSLGAAAIYVELRTAKEGFGDGREAVAAVFD